MLKTNWNQGWQFSKDYDASQQTDDAASSGTWEAINLPHTWNGMDGQDGGNDYYRGTCYYVKHLTFADITSAAATSTTVSPLTSEAATLSTASLQTSEAATSTTASPQKSVYLEFEGANSSADLYINGKPAAHHEGGYSTWRVNITEYLTEDTEILVAVDNSPNDYVYPQMADFTFYGGLYRNVNLLLVNETRFDLDYYGSQGIMVTPTVEDTTALVKVQSYITGATDEETLDYTIFDGEQIVARTSVNAGEEAQLTIENVHLWNGKRDPHLYTLKAVLVRKGIVLDSREVRFGCRSFHIDPDKGFFLNGVSYPLRGVSRHQDRPKIGNALSKKDHQEDLALILEMGATTIRLAHYQHDQYFYDLCDEAGLILWAEIPYISHHLPRGRENTLSQMQDLIVQNYHHPSIVVWGLSNEITMGGANDPDLIENHRLLHELAHKLDSTRLTTIAAVTMCPIDAEYIQIPDVVSYNHYYGWYGGDTSMNGPFFDKFHAKHPNIPIGMSEYGCEALNWHTSTPEQGDYTEEYQAYYHEELIKQLFTRPFIWATHVWNMFDFAADARAEGGEDGMNHKGLVTFDRQYKKDAFYAYKAWLSDEPFVHICGKRYVDRVEEVTKVTVYSNQPCVELFVNGTSLGSKEAADHFFYFEVPNKGESRLTAKAGNCVDESSLRKVDTFNEAYRMKETGDILNWFEIDAPDGYLSINDKIGDILATFRGKLLLVSTAGKLMKGSNKKGGGGTAGFNVSAPDIMKMVSGFTLKRVFSMVGTAGLEPLPKEEILKINKKLNKIKKK